MADHDPMIEALRIGGAPSGHGAFTLDPARARAKLREFQIADPHQYVLLLVQAMVQRGATFIDVTVDADDTVMRSDAAPLDFEELRDLYVLLFADAPPPAGLRELALAGNAVMALDPRWLRIECSGPGGGDGVRLEQRNDAPDHVERVGGLGPGMRVHVRERFGLGIVRRYFAAGNNATREQQVLRHGCRFASLPILLAGEPMVPETPDHTVLAWHEVTQGDRRLGVIGLAGASGPGRLELVRHQVWLTTHTLAEPRLVGVRGVLDVSHLRTDVSMADVVRDDDYAAMLHAVRSAHELALAAACRRHPAGDGLLAGPIREALCHRIGAHLAEADAQDGSMRGAMCAEPGGIATPGGPSRWRFESEPLRDFLRVALWSTVGGERLSSAELLARVPIRYATVDVQPTPPEFADFVFVRGHAEGLLRAAFPRRTVDCSAQVRRASTQAANRAALEMRLHSVVLPAHRDYGFVTRFEADGAHGIIGWAPAESSSWIRVISGERLLAEIPIEPEFGAIHVAVSAAFRPTDMLDDVVRDDVFAAAMHAILAAYGEVFDAVCVRLSTTERPPERTALGLAKYALGTNDGTHAVRWLTAVGLPDAAVRALQERRGRPWRRDVAAIAGGRLDHPLAKLHLFTDASGRPLNLRRVAAHLVKAGTIGVISSDRPKLREPPELVVRVGELRLELLRLAFGAHRLRKVGREYERWLAGESTLLKRTAQSLEGEFHADAILGPIPFTHEGAPCRIALVPREAPDADACTPATIYVGSRRVTQFDLPATLRGAIVAVTVDERWLDGDGTGVLEGGVLAAEDALATGIDALFAALVHEAATADEPAATSLRLAVLDAIVLALPGPGFVRAWLTLDADGDRSDAVGRYLELLGVGGWRDPDALHRALTAMLDRGKHPLPQSLREALVAAAPGDRGWARLRKSAARVLPQLLAVPTLCTAQGPTVSLGVAIAGLAAGGKLDWVRPSTDSASRHPDVVQLDDATRRAVQAVLGAAALRELAPETAAASHVTVAPRGAPLGPATHARLHARIGAELRRLHHEGRVPIESLLALVVVDARDGSHVARRDGDRVIVDAAHPIVARAGRDDASPLLVGVVASSVLSALSHALDLADHLGLLRIHAQLLLADADAAHRG